MKRRFAAAFLLLSLGACAGATGAPPPTHTGRFIVRLKATPPPRRLLVITDRLEVRGQVLRGGKRSPYLLVKPAKPHEFKLPPSLASLVAYVEPEVYMYAINPTETKPLDGNRARIGKPASGKRRRSSTAPMATPAPRLAPLSESIAPLTPNDQYFSYQWGMQSAAFGIGLPIARRYTKGSGVTVGIVDSGIRQSLADLSATMFLPPYNALTSSAGGSDENGHGTHVAGTIAQVTDNRIGCAGVAPAARILSVKALDSNGRGTNFTIGSAIRYAVDHGCSIINLSVGGAPSQTLKDAVAYATSKNVLLVCAAGNGGQASLTYPARYAETLSVGALNEEGRRATFSQYGPGLGIVAPGQEILQQTFSKSTGKSGYFYFSGTSMATPMVTGVAALAKALRPSLTRAELKLLLMGTATDLGPRGTDIEYGAGLLNAAKACERAAGATTPRTPPTPDLPPVPFPPTHTPVPPTPVPDGDLGPDVDPELARINAEVLRLFNMERSRAGLHAVALEARLTQAATAHAADMRSRGVMSHTGGDGSNPGQRMTRAGYPWNTWGEVVAKGQRDAAAITLAWMNSPGHKAIILGSQFTEIGVAKDGAYWAAVFGRR